MSTFQQQIVGSMIGFLIAKLIVYIVDKFWNGRIVHCKDCKYNNGGRCSWHCGAGYKWVVDDGDYCSCGERKEEW